MRQAQKYVSGLCNKIYVNSRPLEYAFTPNNQHINI